MQSKNKNNTQSIVLAFIGLIFMVGSSCKKYLDVKQQSSISLITSASDCQALLDNYDQMNVGYPSDGEASADNYFLNDASYDALSGEDRKIYSWAPDAQRSSSASQWINPYAVVYYANVVLEALKRIGTDSTDAATLDALKGSALFFRTYAFYQVATLYCKPYAAATAAQDPGIPLRLSSDVNGKSERSTVQQTYNQMVQDLQTSVNLLPATSSVSSRPNKAAAYALLARVYLSMEDYVDAGNASNSCLLLNNNLMDYNTISVSSSQPFTRFNKEIIFQSVMKGTAFTTIGGVFVAIGATLNPQIARVDSLLCASYDSNDLRKQIFLKKSADTTITSYQFTGSYEPTYSNTFFDGLATDEIYLIRAECYARAGNTVDALNDLNTLLQTRWAAGTFVPLTAVNPDDALAKVLTERRKELIFRGLRWADLRRLNLDDRFKTTLAHTNDGQAFTLPPNDPRYVLLIPADVISNAGLQQNPR